MTKMGTPSQKQYGFLTEKRKEYLLKTKEEREKELAKIKDDGEREHVKNNWKQHDHHILRQAKQALKDLILVAEAYPENKQSKIFTISLMEMLLSAVVDKQGWNETMWNETTDYGYYFLGLIDSIKGSINAQNNPHLIECDVKLSSRMYNTPPNQESKRPMTLPKDQREAWLKSLDDFDK